MFILITTRVPKLYYREWMSCHGAGVMMSYDTVWAKSKKEAAEGHPRSSYLHWSLAENTPLGYYDSITRVKDKHLDMSDAELSNIYGVKV